MDFKLSQTNKGPEIPAKVVRSELQKFPKFFSKTGRPPKKRFLSSVVNDVQITLNCIQIYFHLFYLNFYLILKPLLYMFGALKVMSEIGGKGIPFLVQIKNKMAQKSYCLAQMQNAVISGPFFCVIVMVR